MDSWASGMALGPYLLLAPIASGGMGEVWKARDTRLDRLVAIKRIKRPHSARFEQEARSFAALNHPHICHLYDVGPDYLVLEYIDGRRLPCPVPLEEALRFATQIAGALAAAHRQKIIHRDLKPANIMVTAERNVKLLDFGLAKLIARTDPEETETMEGNIVGTAAYMSPEQAEGKSVDERSDIFSFGAVFYEIIGGVRAFTGDSKARVLSAVLRDDPPPLSAPPEVDRIVRRCLAKQPGQRFQSVAELLAALEQLAVAPPEPQPSVAVLPFSNLSADKDNQYFSDGLAEEIITALAQIPGLKVTARTSSFVVRDEHEDIRRISERLGVRTVLTGGVRRAANRIRVTAQLINAADGYHLWSDRYDRELADVFAIQDEIAQAISSALQVELAGQPRRPAGNFPAYEALLKGRHLVAKAATPESLARAKELIEQAIALDPNSALARVELGT